MPAFITSIHQWFGHKMPYRDVGLWMIFFLLCAVSLFEVYSASSGQVTASKTHFEILQHHALMLFVGIVLAWVIGDYVPASRFKLLASLGVALGIVALFYTWLWGAEINGARRWISILGFQIQTSEFVKVAYIPFVAHTLAHIKGHKQTSSYFKMLCLILMIAVVLTIGLIVPSNLSMALLYIVITLALAYYADAKFLWQNKAGRWLGIFALAGLMLGGVYLGTAYVNRNEGLSPYVDDRYEVALVAETATTMEEEAIGVSKLMNRATTWHNRVVNHLRDYPTNPRHLDINDKTSQEIYARLSIALSNGGLGVGPGNSKQRDYLSLAYSDFIFALIIEELGMGGAVFVLLLYALLVRQCFAIAKQCTTPYHAYTALGIGTAIGLQVLVNVLVAVGVLPITGQTLPIISHGGSSILANSMLFGLLFSIVRYNRMRMAYEEQQKSKSSRRAIEHAEARDEVATVIPAPALDA